MEEFPLEIQEYFTLYNTLADKWDGMSGTYMGKDWAGFSELCDIYKLEDKALALFFIRYMDGRRSEAMQKKQKATKKVAEAQAKAKKGVPPGV
mgnify:FL=1|jgi:hypothetical protein